MKSISRRVNIANRIKPLEGVGIVLLFLGALMVLLWTAFIAVRFLLG